MGIPAGKKGLIMGVANERSAAWGIAEAAASKGLNLPLPIRLKALKNGWSRWQHQSDQIS